MVKKSVSQTLKKKVQKLEQDLDKLQFQKADLIAKEKALQKSLKETNASYIVALMAESGKSIEELENFEQLPAGGNGGEGHVQDY